MVVLKLWLISGWAGRAWQDLAEWCERKCVYIFLERTEKRTKWSATCDISANGRNAVVRTHTSCPNKYSYPKGNYIYLVAGGGFEPPTWWLWAIRANQTAPPRVVHLILTDMNACCKPLFRNVFAVAAKQKIHPLSEITSGRNLWRRRWW